MVSIVYVEDVERVPKKSEKFVRGADVLIIDAAICNLERNDEKGEVVATGRKIRGHLNTSEALELVKKFKPKVAFLTQLGHTYPNYDETVSLVREYWYQVKGKCESEVHVAHDGLKVSLQSGIQDLLGKSCDGLQIDLKSRNQVELSSTCDGLGINLKESGESEMRLFELLRDVKNYNPSRMRNDVLRDDFRLLCAYYSSKKQGKKIKLSYEDIINLAKLIYDEIERRKAEGRMKHEWHPEKMKKYAKELYTIVSEKGFKKLKPAFGSPGGKLFLRDKVIPLIPEHRVYVETHAGGASVFFGKKPSSVEILNDLDSEIAFYYRFIQSASDEDIAELMKRDWSPSERRWSKFKKELKESELSDAERFYRSYYVRRWSFNKKGETFTIHRGAGTNLRLPSLLKHFDEYRKRLQNVKILNEDAIEVIKRFDSKDTLFYVDPPYPEEWDAKFGYTWEDFEKLIDTLREVKGRFILSINMSDRVREMLPSGWHKIRVKRPTFAPSHRQGITYEYEYLVMNYKPKNYNIYTFEHKEENIPDHQREKIENLDLSMFRDFTVVKDFVSVVGSSVDEQDKEPEDLDLVIRLDPEYSYLKRVIETKLRKLHPKAHPFCEPMGSGDDYLPLYDLVLRRVENPRLVKMDDVLGNSDNSNNSNNSDNSDNSVNIVNIVNKDNKDNRDNIDNGDNRDNKEEGREEEEDVIIQKGKIDCKPMNPFYPMKPGKRFYDVDEVAEYVMEKSGGEDNRKVVLAEEKFNGYRGVIHRKGNRVVIYSDQKRDITFPFPSIVEQAKRISDRDFILDGEIVPYNEKGKPLGRNYAARYIGAVKSKKDISDKNVKFHAFDLLYFDDKCLMGLRQYERKKILYDNFKDTKNIKIVKAYPLESLEQAKKVIRELGDRPGSEGAVLKFVDGVYEPDKESKAWVKYRIELELHVLTIGMLPVKGSRAVRHKLAIYLTEEEAKLIDDEYLSAFNNKPILLLGNSFNTLIRAEPGSILDIHVEEVWRHYNTKTGKYHYSLHKPKVMEVAEKQETSTLRDLDAMVVSRGVEVRMSGKKFEQAELNVRDFPKRMQQSMRKVMEYELWCPFVVQYHYRGHEISDEEREQYDIPGRYRWWLRSLHQDLRLWSPLEVDIEPRSVVKWDPDNEVIRDSLLEGLSIAPDQYVVVKSGTHFFVKQIEDLFESVKSMIGSKRILINGRRFEVVEPKNLRAIGFKYGMGTWVRIRRILRHRYKGKLVLLRQKWGEIKLTPNHSVYDVYGNLVRADQNPELLAIRKLNYDSGLRKKEWTARIYGLYERENDGKLRCRVINQCGELSNHYYDIWVAKKYSGQKLKSLLKFIGAYVSEGCIWHSPRLRQWKVQISNADKEWLQDIAPTDFSNAKIQYRYSYSDHTWCLVINSKPLYQMMKQLCGAGSENKHLPDFVFQLSKSYLRVLLDSMIKGDGHIRRNGLIEYSTKSRKLAFQVCLLFTLLDKDYTIKYNERTQVYSIKECRQYQKPRKKHIEYVDFDGYVYDLELEDTHNFAAGIGNVVCHNTVLTPTTTDPEDTDDFVKGLAAKQGRVRCVLKLPEPPQWLFVEGVAEIGSPGSTPYAPGVFLIVAKGYYTVHRVDDHVLRIQFKCIEGDTNMKVLEEADKKGIYIERQMNKPPSRLKNLNGMWNFQIAHIEPERWVILARLLKPDNFYSDMLSRLRILKRISLSESTIGEIIRLSKDELRPSIANKLGIAQTTVYEYQRDFGLI